MVLMCGFMIARGYTRHVHVCLSTVASAPLSCQRIQVSFCNSAVAEERFLTRPEPFNLVVVLEQIFLRTRKNQNHVLHMWCDDNDGMILRLRLSSKFDASAGGWGVEVPCS